jgi:crotonobetainyl-CoA:carnitine CoA-transferase CaiB-like acyl-CoA transferase
MIGDETTSVGHAAHISYLPLGAVLGNALEYSVAWEEAGLIAGAFVVTNASREEALRRLELACTASATLNSIADLWAHPQLAARQRWTQVQTSAEPIPALWPPGLSSSRMDPVPTLGQHTEQILQELRYPKDYLQ